MSLFIVEDVLLLNDKTNMKMAITYKKDILESINFLVLFNFLYNLDILLPMKDDCSYILGLFCVDDFLLSVQST